MGTNYQYQDAANLYEQYRNENTGKKGFTNSLEMAKEGANAVANNAQAQATTASRNAGLGKSASAMMGANTASSAYANSFAQQQANASQQLANQLNAQGNLMSSRQTEGNNEQTRAWTNVANTMDIVGTAGKTLGKILSDERLKSYKDISSKYNSEDVVSDERLKVYYDTTKEWKD